MPALPSIDQLLEVVLPHVPLDGWTLRAVRRGLDEAGIPLGVFEAWFPDGVDELRREYHRRRRDAFLLHIEKHPPKTAEEPSVTRRVHGFVMARLSFEQDQRAYWRESLVSMQTQGCFPCSLAYELADDAWYGVGDLSYDGHYYSKRLLLAGAVAMTLWIWLNDETQDLQVTSDYLERQLHRVVHLGRSLSSWPRMGQALEKSIKKIPFVRLAWRSLRRSFSP